MSRISEAFKNNKVFIPFITGGDPDIETTRKILYALNEAGAGIIEIGIPFSDPIAEGPVIQEASQRALEAGTTTDSLFELVKYSLSINDGLFFICIVGILSFLSSNEHFSKIHYICLSPVTLLKKLQNYGVKH